MHLLLAVPQKIENLTERLSSISCVCKINMSPLHIKLSSVVAELTYR